MEFDPPCGVTDFPIERIPNSQFTQLFGLIKQCKPLKLERIKEKQQMLQKKAEEILKLFTKVEKFESTTDRITMRTETETQQI